MVITDWVGGIIPVIEKYDTSWSYSFSYYSYIESTINATYYAYAGGICGKAEKDISNCYSTGDVFGGSISYDINFVTRVDASYYRMYIAFEQQSWGGVKPVIHYLEGDPAGKIDVQKLRVAYMEKIYAQPIANGDVNFNNCFYSSDVNIRWNNQTSYKQNIYIIGDEEYDNDGDNKSASLRTVHSESLTDNKYDWGYVVPRYSIDKDFVKLMVNWKTTEMDKESSNGFWLPAMKSYIWEGNYASKNTMQSSDILSNLNANGKDYFGYDPEKNNGYPYLKAIYW